MTGYEHGRVLVFGGRGLSVGYLAGYYCRTFGAYGAARADITDKASALKAITDTAPDVVLNAAGMTHSPSHPTIDGCQHDDYARARTHLVNVIGPMVLRDICAARRLPLIHLGSGCIFDGRGSVPQTEESDPNPVSYYAETKVHADMALREYSDALILRLRLPVSDDWHPRNTLRKLAGYTSVVDAPNSITDVESLITATWQLLHAGKRGIYNVVNPGPVSPFDMATAIQGGAPERLTPGQLNRLTLANRSNCVLSTAKLEAAGVRLIDADLAVRHHVARLKEWKAVA
jgi:3,5-epimerase/4-reductase